MKYQYSMEAYAQTLELAFGDAQKEWSQIGEEASVTFEYSSKVIDRFNLFRLIVKCKAWQACLVFWYFL